MTRSWLLIGLVGSLLVRDFGLAVQQSGKNVSKGAAIWNAIPSLNAERGGSSLDSILNGRMQMSGMDKVLQAADSKKSIRHAEEGLAPGDLPREKRSGEKSPGAKVGDVGAADPSTTEEAVADARQNVVLVMVDEAGQDREAPWKTLRTRGHSFPVQGFLQSCRNDGPTTARYSLNLLEVLVTGSKDKDCDCEYLLRTNMDSLLFWTRFTKGMATVEYDVGGVSRGFQVFDGNSVKPEAHPSRYEYRDDAWQLVELEKEPNNVTTAVAPATKQYPAGGYDEMRDVFDVFSKFRIALSRTLLGSVDGYLGGGSEDELPPRGPSFPLQSGLAELLRDTIRELELAANNKGYVLLATVPGSELPAALDLLERATSSRDTLLVVVGSCARDRKPVPFYASGPGARMIHEARAVWELPASVKKAIVEGCRGVGCKGRRHGVSASEVAPHKRFARSEESPEDNVTELLDKSAVSSKNVTKGEKKSKSSAEAASAILGLAVLAAATLALRS